MKQAFCTPPGHRHDELTMLKGNSAAAEAQKAASDAQKRSGEERQIANSFLTKATRSGQSKASKLCAGVVPFPKWAVWQQKLQKPVWMITLSVVRQHNSCLEPQKQPPTTYFTPFISSPHLLTRGTSIQEQQIIQQKLQRPSTYSAAVSERHIHVSM